MCANTSDLSHCFPDCNMPNKLGYSVQISWGMSWKYQLLNWYVVMNIHLFAVIKGFDVKSHERNCLWKKLCWQQVYWCLKKGQPHFKKNKIKSKIHPG